MTTASSLRPGLVPAWYAHVNVLEAPGRHDRAMSWLSPRERIRHDRFRNADDQLLFLMGRVMARTLVGRAAGRDPRSWRWREGPRGRPEVADPDVAIQFNLAHSAGLVVCALAADHAVGADVEDRGRRPLDPHVVARYCAPAEVADINAQGADGWHDRFLTYWTLKESYLKARGLGIAVPLADVELTLEGHGATLAFRGTLTGTDARWAFRLATPTDRHLVAIAAPTDAGPIDFRLDLMPDEWLP